MEKPDVFLSALPDDDVTREVVGYGCVRRAPSGATETQVRVHWATPRLDGLFDEIPPDHLRIERRMVSRWIGCGSLALVPIGSQWRRKMLVRQAKLQLHSATAVCTGVETIGRSVAVPGAQYYPFDRDPSTKCFRLELDGDRRKVALVPIIEVIRAAFGCSSSVLRQLFDGVRDPAMARRRFLFDRGRSACINRRASIYCHSKPTERQAWVAAMIMASDAFRASHDGVFAGFQASGGLNGGATCVVDTSFPFAQVVPVGLAFESRFVHIAPGSQMAVAKDGTTTVANRATTGRLLVTRILAFESETAFDEVAYSWPRFRTRKDLPPSTGCTFTGKKRSIVLVDGIPPDTLHTTLRLSVEGAAALALKGVVFVSEPRLAADRGEKKKVVVGGSTEVKGSTADPHWQGDEDVTPLELDANGSPGNPEAALGAEGVSLVKTDCAVRALVSRRNWSASGLAASVGSKPPMVLITDGRSSMHIVEIEVRTDQGPVLIYERGSTATQKRALGFVARDGMAPFSSVELQAIREKILEWRAHWLGNRRLDGFVVAGLVRPSELPKNELLYAQRIEEKIKYLISWASAP